MHKLSEAHSAQAHRECHLSNAIEEHLQGCKEEEARVQVRIVDAVSSNVSTQEQSCADDTGKCRLHCIHSG